MPSSATWSANSSAAIFGAVAGDVAGKNTGQMTPITSAAVPPEWYVVSTLVGLWFGFFGAPWLASRDQGTRHLWADLGVRFRWIDLWGHPVGVGAQIVIALLYAPFQHDIQDFNGPSQKLTGGSHGAGLVVVVLATVLLAPFMEELFFRGPSLQGSGSPLRAHVGAGPTRARRGRRPRRHRRRAAVRAGPRRMGPAGGAGVVRGRPRHDLLPDRAPGHEHGVARLFQPGRHSGHPQPTGRCPLTSTIGRAGHRKSDAGPARQPPNPPPTVEPFPTSRWAPAVATFLCVASVIAVVLWQMHPSLLLSTSTPTGGDNGGHFAMPAFLKSNLLSHGQLTGWDPGWYDGFPLYTYYFVLPDLLAALASYAIPYALAFKWVTVLGSVLLPVAAWAMGRLFGMRRGLPRSRGRLHPVLPVRLHVHHLRGEPLLNPGR